MPTPEPHEGELLPAIPLGAALPDGRTLDDLRRATYAGNPEQAAVEGGYGLPAARAQAGDLSALYPDRVSPDPDPELLPAIVEPEVVEGELLPAVWPTLGPDDDPTCVGCLTGQADLHDHREPEPEVLEGELLDPVDPHGVKATDRGAVVALVCRCGEWEAVAGGPSSLAWASRDHRRHVTEATGTARS